MTRRILINGKSVGMRVTALTPRKYRFRFGQDIFTDAETLHTKLGAAMRGEAQFTANELMAFQNITWMCAKEYDNAIPETPDKWISTFKGFFSIYLILPQVISLFYDSANGLSRFADKNKGKKETTRKNNTATFMLRCTELGLTASELETMDIGMVYDMLIERANDEYQYPIKATKEEIRAFFG